MADKLITTEQLQEQVDAYTHVQPDYKTFADILKRVLGKACKKDFPCASVEARAKEVASFAEKVVRKAGKYQNAMKNMTDLCGARVIVQTLSQVEAVREFIRDNFEVCEEDDKTASLEEDVFGYGDIHFIVQLKIPSRRKEQFKALGITDDKAYLARLGITDDQEIAAISGKKAEIQVRTWLQHALADTLHDRLYKTPLEFSREIKRTAKMLDAIRENADKTLNGLCDDIDSRLAHYSSYASREKIEEEIEQLRLLLLFDGNWKTALKRARLQTAIGDYDEAIKTLAGYDKDDYPSVLIKLGELYRLATDKDYSKAREVLERVIALLDTKPDKADPYDKTVLKGLQGRAHFLLAKVLDKSDEGYELAEIAYQKALECKPNHPYWLSEAIGHKLRHGDEGIIRHSDDGTIRKSSEYNYVKNVLEACYDNIKVGIEMPYACFVAGRLHAFLGEPLKALDVYALGAAVIGRRMVGVPKDVFKSEKKWLRNVTRNANHADPAVRKTCDWCARLLELADKAKLAEPVAVEPKAETDKADKAKLPEPIESKAGMDKKAVRVKIIAGGAVKSFDPDTKEAIRPLVKIILKDFGGRVCSGGTNCGVPGIVGDVAREIGFDKKRLIGYIPINRPDDAPPHNHYTVKRIGEVGFTPEQIITCWEDLFKEEITPSEINVIGFGGGPLCAFEYRLALMLGVEVWVFNGFGGTAVELGNDANWSRINDLPLFIVPDDEASCKAFANQRTTPYTDAEREMHDKMGQHFHAKYAKEKRQGNLKDWADLDQTFKIANWEQAAYSATILNAMGFVVERAKDPTRYENRTEKELEELFKDCFTSDEIEKMAEMEHGRWNVERLRAGWRYGPKRDDAKKIHDCILPWKNLSDSTKKWDRNAIIAFPAILARMGWEVSKGTGVQP